MSIVLSCSSTKLNMYLCFWQIEVVKNDIVKLFDSIKSYGMSIIASLLGAWYLPFDQLLFHLVLLCVSFYISSIGFFNRCIFHWDEANWFDKACFLTSSCWLLWLSWVSISKSDLPFSFHMYKVYYFFKWHCPISDINNSCA